MAAEIHAAFSSDSRELAHQLLDESAHTQQLNPTAMKKFQIIPAVIAASLCPASAVVFFEDGFDSAAADVTINQAADTEVTFVDYSSFTVGTTNFAVAEAPNPIAGSVATSGILIRANLSAGLGAAVNIVAGATPLSFTGNYRLSFDAYLEADLNVGGSTEQLLWGIGDSDGATAFGRNNRSTEGSGVWGWLAGENGYGTEDSAIFQDVGELADLGDTQPGENGPFNAAFTNDIGGPNAEALREWVHVDIVAEAGTVSTYFNGVQFFSESGLSTDGFAMLGYEDPFGSSVSTADGNWGLFDNFLVTDDLTVVPEPSACVLALLGGAIALRRRRR